MNVEEIKKVDIAKGYLLSIRNSAFGKLNREEKSYLLGAIGFLNELGIQNIDEEYVRAKMKQQADIGGEK